MGWRFRRSFKIAPGIRWNISKSGTSWSIGPRGLTFNLGRRGVRRTISLRGTGLSHSQMIGSTPQSPRDQSAAKPGPLPPSREDLFTVEASSIAPLTDEAAIEAASQWALRRSPLVGRMLRPAVIGVDRNSVNRAEVIYSVRSRRIVVQTEPLPRKVRVSSTLPGLNSFDVWSPAILTELDATRGIATCPSCSGEGRLRCARCDGRVEVICDVCSGSGDVVSERTFRIIKCRACGGDGWKRCACRDGVVACQACNAKGVATAWLALQETTRQERRVEGSPEFAELSGQTVIRANVERVCDMTAAVESLPDHVRNQLARHSLRFVPGDVSERVDQVQVIGERSVSATVAYELAGRRSHVVVHAWNGRVEAANKDGREPFRTVTGRLWKAFVIAALSGVAASAWFVGRHAYYTTAPQTPWLLLLTLVFPFLVLVPIAYRALPDYRRTSWKLLAAVLPVALVLAGSVRLWASAGPSLQRAEQLLMAGEFESAKREIRAALDLSIVGPEGQTLHDEIQLAQLATTNDPASHWSQLLRTEFLTAGARTRAESRAMEHTASFAAALQAKGQYAQSLAVLASLPDVFRRSDSIRVLLRTAKLQQVTSLWLTAKSASRLADRLEACRAISQPLKEIEDDRLLPAAKREINATCTSVQAQDAARLKREAQATLAAQRRSERMAAEEQRRQEAAAREWAMAPLMCRDGTPSPSCVCGGSHRGCCSHHGGVAGCSR